MSRVTEIEREILTSLRELELAVGAPAATPPRSLLPLFARLDGLGAQLPPGADPNLRHYLQRKSYEKARLLLEGREAANTGARDRAH